MNEETYPVGQCHHRNIQIQDEPLHLQQPEGKLGETGRWMASRCHKIGLTAVLPFQLTHVPDHHQQPHHAPPITAIRGGRDKSKLKPNKADLRVDTTNGDTGCSSEHPSF